MQSTAYTPLDKVTSPLVKTDAAAHYLLRSPDTLYAWSQAHPDDRPLLRPVKLGARLGWSVDRIRDLVKGGA